MKKYIVLTIAMALLAGCAVNRYRSDLDFANKLAAEGLWKEAHFRMQKALAANGSSPQLHNNLAVILESLDRPAEAEQEYQKAMRLAPGNTHIQGNYERFKKNQKKDKKEKPEEKKNEK